MIASHIWVLSNVRAFDGDKSNKVFDIVNELSLVEHEEVFSNAFKGTREAEIYCVLKSDTKFQRMYVILKAATWFRNF